MILWILFFCSISNAQEEAPVYNLGTMQADRTLSIEPGKTGFARLYFFNIHGNRVTHVRLYIREAPEEWTVTVEPDARLEQFNVSGIIINSTENLYVRPILPVAEKPASIPEGFEYVTMENVTGYVPARITKIIIKVPENAVLGKTYKIGVEAIANWFGQTGTVAFSQSRAFEYYVTTVTQKYTEEPVKPGSESKAEQQFPWMYVAVVLLVAVIILSVLYLRKRKEH